jgi:pilus assembly protein Flp/PilA
MKSTVKFESSAYAFFKTRPLKDKRSLVRGLTQEHTMSKLVEFLRNESGATAIEYGLIAAGISVAIIAVVQGIGTNLNTTFGSVQTALK